MTAPGSAPGDRTDTGVEDTTPQRPAPAPAAGVPNPERAGSGAADDRQGLGLPHRPATGRPPGLVTAPRPRRAHLVLAQVDPWSVMKIAFLLSLGFGIMIFIAVAVLWSMLDAMGVFSSVSVTVNDIVGDDFDLMEYLSLSRVLGFTLVIGLVDLVLVTALATLGAYLYNLASAMAGGLRVTLTEER